MPSQPRKVLLIEDDASIRREVMAALHAAEFNVEVAMSCREAKGALPRGFDCLVLDLGLPDGDGLDLCRSLRHEGMHVPILVLTARDLPAQRVEGLQSGADDYLSKPFYAPELVARLNNILQRATGKVVSGRLVSGDLWADPELHLAGRADQSIPMKPRELELLLFFMRHPGRTWTRAQLLDRVWGVTFDGDERTVDSHVRKLRSAIEVDSSNPQMLQTVWGVGYRWRN